MLDSVAILSWAAPQAWTAADNAGLKQWVSKWLYGWVLVKPGDSDRTTKNNHADFYDTLTATCAFFVGNTTIVQRICANAPEDRIAVQVAVDGSLPAEERRTKSESYHAFALTGLLDLAWICRATPSTPDLFGFSSKDGRSLLSALDWLAPYADGKNWTAPQIIPFDTSAFVTIFRSAASGYPKHASRFAALAGKQPGGSTSRQSLLRPYTDVNLPKLGGT